MLSLSSSLYFLVILGWTFTTLPDKHAFTVPLLVALHMLMGIASAGINIATTTIRMKMAPQAQAMTYLTAASLASSAGAGVSPLLGGAFADFFSVRHLEIAVQWVDPVRTIGFPAVFLTGFDFLFAIAFVLGLVTLGVLAGLREEGEAESDVVMDELVSQTRQNLRVLNSVPGLSFVANLPVASLRRLPPIPGLDVAVGVTAHQLSSTIKATVEGLNYGQVRAGELTVRVRQAVEGAADTAEQIGRQGAELATGATEGAMWAAADATMEAGRVAEEAVRGTMQALAKTAADPLDALRGAMHGVIQGASEAGLHVGHAVRHAVKAALGSASDLGVSEQQVRQTAARAAVDSAAHLGREMETEVADAILQALMEDPGPRSAGRGPPTIARRGAPTAEVRPKAHASCPPDGPPVAQSPPGRGGRNTAGPLPRHRSGRAHSHHLRDGSGPVPVGERGGGRYRHPAVHVPGTQPHRGAQWRRAGFLGLARGRPFGPGNRLSPCQGRVLRPGGGGRQGGGYPLGSGRLRWPADRAGPGTGAAAAALLPLRASR